jgi:regulator of cell morphogenesis and NO signaling
VVSDIPLIGARRSVRRNISPQAQQKGNLPMSATTSSGPGFASRTLADIAVTLPGATEIFRRHKLDFCCGGRVPLAQAATAKGVALDKLEAELGAVAALSVPAPQTESTEALISLIGTRYHAVHRRELPELLRLARRVEAVHKDRADVPRGIAALLERLGVELEQHMQKEEKVLFPLMLRGGQPMIVQPIAAMLAEHDDHGDHLRTLENLTGGFSAPDDACATWRALYVGAKKLANDLVEHIHTENNVLFPRFQGGDAPAR